MNPELYERAKSIVQEALVLDSESRDDVIAVRCAGDGALEKEVRSWIAASERAGSFLDGPAIRACGGCNTPVSGQERQCANCGCLIDEDARSQYEANVAHAHAIRSELVGMTLDNKYLVEREIGKGGMGSVYRCIHIGTERPIALKVIHPHFGENAEFLDRFRREARAAGRLRHPNVVNVTDFGVVEVRGNTLAYLAMEYLEGETLGDFARGRSSMPTAFVIEVLDQIASAIDAAHELGIVHRDLKPDNIWLEPNRRGGVNAKVLDFGIAKLLAPSYTADGLSSVPPDDRPESTETPHIEPRKLASTGRDQGRRPIESVEHPVAFTRAAIDPQSMPHWKTRVGTVLGTPAYMSPEQCRGAELDRRSDVYSLGVIVYELLARRLPFTSDEWRGFLIKHNEMPPEPLHIRRPDLDRGICDVVMSALAKSPADRPPMAGAFARRLRFHVDGEAAIWARSDDVYRPHATLYLNAALCFSVPIVLLGLSMLVVPLGAPGVRSIPARYAFPLSWCVLFVLVLVFVTANMFTVASCLALMKAGIPEKACLTRALRSTVSAAPTILILAICSIVSAVANALRVCVPAKHSDGRLGLASIALWTPVVALERTRALATAVRRSRNLAEGNGSLLFGAVFRKFAFAAFVVIALQFVLILLAFLWDTMVQWRFDNTVVIRNGLFGIVVPILMILVVARAMPRHAIAEALLFNECSAAEGVPAAQTLEEAPRAFGGGARIPVWRRPLAAVMFAAAMLIGGYLGLESLLLPFAIGEGKACMTRAMLGAVVGYDLSKPMLNPHSESVFQEPLVVAASTPDERMVRVLLDEGANPDGNGSLGGPPLQAAAARGSVGTMRLLLAHGASVDNCPSALEFAAMTCNPAAVTVLTDLGVSPDGPDARGGPLIAATGAMCPDTIRLLVSLGADVNAKGDDGWTVLMVCSGAYSGNQFGGASYRKALETLIAAGARLEDRDNAGRTALHFAARGFNATAVDELLKAGADPSVRDSDGKTPFDYASDPIEIASRGATAAVSMEVMSILTAATRR